MKVLGGFLGVDGDDFTATASNQEDPIQTLEENLQELHVWENSSQGKAHTQAHQVSHPTSQWMCNECVIIGQCDAFSHVRGGWVGIISIDMARFMPSCLDPALTQTLAHTKPLYCSAVTNVYLRYSTLTLLGYWVAYDSTVLSYLHVCCV